MECSSFTWRFFSYSLCDAYTSLAMVRTWAYQNPQQVAQLITIFLLLTGFFWWWKRSHHFKHKANQRAEHLLKQSLTQRQYQQLQALGFLELPSRLTTNQFYRIPRSRGRVKVFETYGENSDRLYRLKAELCMVPCENIPDADLILAHKWMIEGDERTYVTVANWTWRPSEEWRMEYSRRENQ